MVLLLIFCVFVVFWFSPTHWICSHSRRLPACHGSAVVFVGPSVASFFVGIACCPFIKPTASGIRGIGESPSIVAEKDVKKIMVQIVDKFPFGRSKIVAPVVSKRKSGVPRKMPGLRRNLSLRYRTVSAYNLTILKPSNNRKHNNSGKYIDWNWSWWHTSDQKTSERVQNLDVKHMRKQGENTKDKLMVYSLM